MDKNRLRVLIVDDEAGMCKLLKEIIQDLGYSPKPFTSPRKALAAIKQEKFDIAIIDVKMPEMDGLELLKNAREIIPDLDVIMITAYGSIESAVEAIKIGAFNYITKPFRQEEIKIAVGKIVERKNLIDENARLRQELIDIQSGGSIIGKNSKMMEIIKFSRKIAGSKYSVLITGESGTGKEVFAKFIHNQSGRKDSPFIAVQCNLIQKNLLESELFGHKKGSFTGADSDRDGLFAEANGGTIFLDEIGDIDPDIQGKLLRFLQDHEIRRVGETKSRVLDVRMISATNKNLEDLVKKERFREDLYYRLKVITIHIHPLRERKEDIPLLVRHFLDEIAKESKTPVEIDKDCFRHLAAYNWPGNVRELRNCIETASTICDDGVIRPSDISKILSLNELVLPSDRQSFKDSKEAVLKEFERNFITNLLMNNKGNITASARDAGMDKKNFWDLMKKHGIKHGDYKDK